MKNKFIFLAIFSILALFTIVKDAEAAVVCTLLVNGTAVANNLVITTDGANYNITVNGTDIGGAGVQNISLVQLNFTALNSTVITFTNTSHTANQSSNFSTRVLTGSGNYNSSAIAAILNAFNETTYNITATAFVNATQNISLCTTTYTGVVFDIFDIAVPTLNSPASGLNVISKTASTLFNVSSGRNGEQIKTAKLYLEGNSYDMTVVDTLATQFTYALVNPPKSKYNWYVLVTDTDSSTTARSAERTIQFDYSTGSSQLPSDLLPAAQEQVLQQEQSSNAILLIAVLGGAYLIFFRKKGGN